MINTKQIPFFDYVVLEENFNEAESYHNFNFVIQKKENCFGDSLKLIKNC